MPLDKLHQIVVPQPAKPFHLLVGHTTVCRDLPQPRAQRFIEFAAVCLPLLVHGHFLPRFGNSFVRVGCAFSQATSLAITRSSSPGLRQQYRSPLSFVWRCFHSMASRSGAGVSSNMRFAARQKSTSCICSSCRKSGCRSASATLFIRATLMALC